MKYYATVSLSAQILSYLLADVRGHMNRAAQAGAGCNIHFFTSFIYPFRKCRKGTYGGSSATAPPFHICTVDRTGRRRGAREMTSAWRSGHVVATRKASSSSIGGRSHRNTDEQPAAASGGKATALCTRTVPRTRICSNF